MSICTKASKSSTLTRKTSVNCVNWLCYMHLILVVGIFEAHQPKLKFFNDKTKRTHPTPHWGNDPAYKPFRTWNLPNTYHRGGAANNFLYLFLIISKPLEAKGWGGEGGGGAKVNETRWRPAYYCTGWYWVEWTIKLSVKEVHILQNLKHNQVET